MSLYADYITERAGKKILENDDGFVVYSFHDENILYIEDIYVRPELRRSRYAWKMADYVVELGKKRGCRVLLGSVVPSANGADRSMKMLMAYGMSIASARHDIVYFQMDL